MKRTSSLRNRFSPATKSSYYAAVAVSHPKKQTRKQVLLIQPPATGRCWRRHTISLTVIKDFILF